MARGGTDTGSIEPPSGALSSPSLFLRAALAYATRFGWAVFPCAGKVPAIRGGRGCLDASIDCDTIRVWWQKYPSANVGIATGAASGFWVLDVDGQTGEESLRELESRHSALPDTPEQHTGGGGRHLCFRYDAALPIRNAVRFMPGLDVRTNGGYIIGAPSVHPVTKRTYVWSVDSHPADLKPVNSPEWLLALVTDSHKGGGGARASAEWQASASAPVPEGRRNQTLARVAGHLLRHGIDAYLALDLALSWNATRCRPPLPEAEVVRTVDSIAGRELRRRGLGT